MTVRFYRFRFQLDYNQAPLPRCKDSGTYCLGHASYSTGIRITNIRRFKEISVLAVEHKGGKRALQKALAETTPLRQPEIVVLPSILSLGDDSSCVLCRLFYQRRRREMEVFKSAFERFDLNRCSEISSGLGLRFNRYRRTRSF